MNLSKQDLKKKSKFLSLILRHHPELIEIQLDENGWVFTKDLISQMNDFGDNIDFPTLESIVATSDKKRFAFNNDQSKIRANQGHSIQVDLKLEPKTPPQFLFHGTVQKFFKNIQLEGLKKMERHHVHLSSDIGTAKNVGSRRGKPIILKIEAQKMHKDGVTFFLSKNGVWLTDHVDPKYFSNT